MRYLRYLRELFADLRDTASAFVTLRRERAWLRRGGCPDQLPF